MSAPVVEQRRPSRARLVGFVVLLTAVAWGLGVFASYPLTLSPGDALLTVAFKHVAAFEHEERKLSREELERLPRHMRPPEEVRFLTGRRVESLLQVVIDGQQVRQKAYQPSGFRGNGPTYVHEEISISPGTHHLELLLTDATSEEEKVERDKDKREHRRQWRLAQDLQVRPRQVLLIGFSEEAGLTVR